MQGSAKVQSRFNARLPEEHKRLLEHAAYLGGYRSLTDFIMLTAQEKAREIIREKDQIIASEKDAHVFFQAITHFKQPSGKLKKALQEYRSFMTTLKHQHDRTTKQKAPSK